MLDSRDGSIQRFNIASACALTCENAEMTPSNMWSSALPKPWFTDAMSKPKFSRWGSVSPAFLSRCKSIHEIWQKVPNAFLRDLLVHAGHARATVKDLGSLKLLQGLANALERLNRDGESLDAFGAEADPDDLINRNASLAPLFINNDLRIADAHNPTKRGGRISAAIGNWSR